MYQYGYDEHVLRRRLENYFKKHKMIEAQRALEYAWEKHEGQKRLNGQPFIVHPLFVANFGIALGADISSTLTL